MDQIMLRSAIAARPAPRPIDHRIVEIQTSSKISMISRLIVS